MDFHREIMNFNAYCLDSMDISLSPKEVEGSRNISTIRIHIEQVIGLSNSQKDETNLAAIDKLVHVCAALINMTDGIVYNDKV